MSRAPRRVGPVMRTVQRALTHAHRRALTVSGGRFAARVGSSQVGVLTTTGRRSGLPRSTPLFVYPTEHGWLCVASNGGTATAPLWFSNLQADPRGSLSVAGVEQAVTAHVLTAEEKAATWPRLTGAYRGFARYQARAQRDIPVVELRRVR